MKSMSEINQSEFSENLRTDLFSVECLKLTWDVGINCPAAA